MQGAADNTTGFVFLAPGSLEAEALVIEHLPWESLNLSSSEEKQTTFSCIAQYAERLCAEKEKDLQQWVAAAQACLQVVF